MGWESFNLKDASPSEPQLPISDGTRFTFTGANLKKWDDGSETLFLNAAVAEDNEYQGQRVSVRLPDPVKNAWVGKVAARFREALGVTIHNGEGTVAAFNSAVNTTFIAPVKAKRPYVNREGITVGEGETELNMFAVRAAD